jgi:predicted nucleic acid-binding protein
LVSLFIDTAVIMYAGGGDHPLRKPCGQIIQRVGTGELDAVTSAEVVQEILHRFMAIRRPDIGGTMARRTMDTFAPVIPITHALMRRVPDLIERYPTLSARDLVHVATCIQEGIVDIVSPDRGFDVVKELRRVSPEDFAS